MKTMIVTGSNRGIGLELAHQALILGYRVIGSSTKGKPTLEHPQYLHCPLQLDNEQSIKTFANQIQSQTTAIDVLINNAGILIEDWSSAEMDLDILRRTFEVNVFGLIHLTELLIPKVNRGGRIFNMSSGWGSITDPNLDGHVPHYKMSKGAVNFYSRLLAKRLEDHKIEVLAINPGWVKTDMGGPLAPTTVQESAHHILKLLEQVNASGNFYSFGKKIDW